MNNVEDKVKSIVRIMMNKKRCGRCYTPYSSSSVYCEIVPVLSPKEDASLSHLADVPVTMFDVMYSESDTGDTDGTTASQLFTRQKLVKNRVQKYMPALALKIGCMCGHLHLIKITTGISQ